jgi:hypothetical protein
MEAGQQAASTTAQKYHLNHLWMYLVRDLVTRNAGNRRNVAVRLLRRDLDIQGLESFDFAEGATLLKKLQEEIDSMK